VNLCYCDCIVNRTRACFTALLTAEVLVVLTTTTDYTGADTRRVPALSSQHELVVLTALESLRSSGSTGAIST
jgi:hypothetical protein